MSDYNLESYATSPLDINSIPCVAGVAPTDAKREESYFVESDDDITENASTSINLGDTDSDDDSESDPCLPSGDITESRIFGRGVSPMLPQRDDSPEVNWNAFCCGHIYVASVVLLSIIAIGGAIYKSWNYL